jgi:hypothetical protein
VSSPSNGKPTGPADLREAAYQARLAEREAEEAAAKAKRAEKRKTKTSKDAIEAHVAGVVIPTAKVAAKRVTKNRAKIDVKVPAALALVPPVENIIPEPIHPTREAWMLAAVEAMRPWYVEADLAPVPDVSISVGWAGGRGKKVGVRGQCWASHTTSDKRPAVFITPDNDNPFDIVGIILHEMNHAADDGVSGHKGAFAKRATALGFQKPFTSSEGKSPELVERLNGVLSDLGPFPHGSITDRSHGLTGLNPLAPPIQTTRMLKVECLACGCILRMTAKWINDAGLPTCGCGEQMVQAV